MKTTRTMTLMVVAFFMMTGLASAVETTASMAKKELVQEITEVFKNDIKEWNNYFYKNDIHKMEEKVQVCFIVNGDQSLSIVRLSCKDGAAKDYVKHVFKTHEIIADKVLVGNAYVVNLALRYEAR
jgi:hypothetical protein